RRGEARNMPLVAQAHLMSTLVFVEHHDGEPVKGSLGVLGKAAQLGDDVSAVLLGSGVEGLGEAVGKHGASRVLVADDLALEAPLPQPRVDVVAKVVGAEGVGNVGVGG